MGSSLLREETPAPDLTAVTEATVGAIYEVIRLMVEWEIDQPAAWRISPSWQELVLAASQEKQFEGLLDPESADMDGWEVLIGSLADGVLWDEDWKEAGAQRDADPTAGRAVKEVLGIDEDYFIAVPPDPTDEEMKGVWATLRGLTKGGS